jgi:branched-chain amino acid transport system substrate-binding protein
MKTNPVQNHPPRKRFHLALSNLRKTALTTALTLGAIAAGPLTTVHADEQNFPLQSYRVGPYAAGGTGFFGGFIDYLNLINTRDGGVNGVKLTWEEGETQYEVERGVEVYERLKNTPGIAAWNPLSVGIAYAMIDRITADKVPLITINHGRTDSTDGRVFPYVFPLLLNPYSETSAIVNYIGSKVGGLDKLKGKKLVVLYHGSPYGKETIPIYELLAQKYGFALQQIEVLHPGNEQQSQWLTIRRARPDYVVLRGWGVMNPVALKTAQKVGFPVDHIVGNVWSNSEEDVIPAGDAAKGYVAITTQASGAQYPVVQEIVKTVYGAGKGNLADQSRIGSVYHNLGVVNGILNVEAIRVAQGKFGHRTLTGDEVRWGFEHLKLDPARVKALGAEGLFHSINVTWDNHEGDGYVTFQQWNGKKWNVVSDWIAPDWALLRPIIEKSSTAYAAVHHIALRTSEEAETAVGPNGAAENAAVASNASK